MSAPVKLPRRLPDREQVRSSPPTEADWLRRAIRCCEHWADDNVQDACGAPYETRSCSASIYSSVRDNDSWAGWLPEHLRRVPLAELRQRLAALEAEEHSP